MGDVGPFDPSVSRTGQSIARSGALAQAHKTDIPGDPRRSLRSRAGCGNCFSRLWRLRRRVRGGRAVRAPAHHPPFPRSAHGAEAKRRNNEGRHRPRRWAPLLHIGDRFAASMVRWWMSGGCQSGGGSPLGGGAAPAAPGKRDGKGIPKELAGGQIVGT